MQFEWDDRKNRTNFKKHGVWFEEAQTVWADIRSTEFLNSPENVGEERFIRVGFSTRLNVLLVVFCEREEGETVRIISARKATRKERGQYEERV